MSQHEDFNDFYKPENVDEQIDSLLQKRRASARDLRLARDLRGVLADHNEEDRRSLDSVLHRLLEEVPDQDSESRDHAALSNSRPQIRKQERSNRMYTEARLPGERKRAEPTRLLTTLVAVLVIAIVVGSLLFTLNASRQKSGNLSAPNTTNNHGLPAPVKDEGKIIYRLNGLNPYMAAEWSPDGTRLASAAMPNQTKSGNEIEQVKSWNATNGQNMLTYQLDNETYISGIAWSPDGTRLAVSGSKIYVFNATTAQRLSVFTSPPTLGKITDHTSLFYNVTWSPDSKHLATSYYTYSSTNYYVTFIWNATTGLLERTLMGFINPITDIAWSSTGNLLATLTYHQAHTEPMISPSKAIPVDTPSEVQIWNTTTWQVVKRYPDIYALDWSPDGKQLALVDARQIVTTNASNAKTVVRQDVRIVDPLTGQTIKKLATKSSEIAVEVRWSPDGSRLALGYQSTYAYSGVDIWSAQSGSLLYSLPEKHVSFPRWSPDSKYLSSFQSTSITTQIVVWVA